MQRRHAYTMVEILTVLAILAILTAILLPVIVRARQRASQTTCLANLTQIHHALTLYLNDFDDVYPQVSFAPVNLPIVNQRLWGTALLPYYRGHSVFSCPSVDNAAVVQSGVLPEDATGYALNLLLNNHVVPSQHDPGSGRQESMVRYPAVTIQVTEARACIQALGAPDTIQSQLPSPCFYTTSRIDYILRQSPGAKRHNGGANIVFVDGHAKWVQPSALETGFQSDGVKAGFGL